MSLQVTLVRMESSCLSCKLMLVLLIKVRARLLYLFPSIPRVCAKRNSNELAVLKRYQFAF